MTHTHPTRFWESIYLRDKSGGIRHRRVPAMIDACRESVTFGLQEGAPQEWKRIVDTALPSPHDFAHCGVALADMAYAVAPLEVVPNPTISGFRSITGTVCKDFDFNQEVASQEISLKGTSDEAAAKVS